jgi:endonuclease/exonuclease/phosphatase family metal-dependent hydrolase
MVGVIEAISRNPAARLLTFAAIPRDKTILLVYSVHFKSNRGVIGEDIAKREEAARQLLAHACEMQRLYSKVADIATVIAGDFNTDPIDPRFASEQTFKVLRAAGFEWSWENIPAPERVTLPAKDRYPGASFDGFLVRGAQVLSCKANPIQEVSDHFPAILTIAIH